KKKKTQDGGKEIKIKEQLECCDKKEEPPKAIDKPTPTSSRINNMSNNYYKNKKYDCNHDDIEIVVYPNSPTVFTLEIYSSNSYEILKIKYDILQDTPRQIISDLETLGIFKSYNKKYLLKIIKSIANELEDFKTGKIKNNACSSDNNRNLLIGIVNAARIMFLLSEFKPSGINFNSIDFNINKDLLNNVLADIDKADNINPDEEAIEIQGCFKVRGNVYYVNRTENENPKSYRIFKIFNSNYEMVESDESEDDEKEVRNKENGIEDKVGDQGIIEIKNGVENLEVKNSEAKKSHQKACSCATDENLSRIEASKIKNGENNERTKEVMFGTGAKEIKGAAAESGENPEKIKENAKECNDILEETEQQSKENKGEIKEKEFEEKETICGENRKKQDEIGTRHKEETTNLKKSSQKTASKLSSSSEELISYSNETKMEHFVINVAKANDRSPEVAEEWIKILSENDIEIVRDLRILVDEDWDELKLPVFASRSLKNALYGKNKLPVKENEQVFNQNMKDFDEKESISAFVREICRSLDKENKADLWETKLLNEDIRNVGDLRILHKDDWKKLNLTVFGSRVVKNYIFRKGKFL
ncbi:Serine/threonine-protein kinase pkpA, partial [Dictyocoela roeselum]